VGLQAVASKVSEEELERAKKATISSVLMNLESRAVVAEDIGRQVLTYGHRYPLLHHWCLFGSCYSRCCSELDHLYNVETCSYCHQTFLSFHNIGQNKYCVKCLVVYQTIGHTGLALTATRL